MKTSKIISLLIVVGLIALYLSGIVEGRAFDFIKSVQEKNIGFLALIAEIKLVFAGLGSLNVPFISGHSSGLQDSLNKVEDYLLFTNIVSFLQLLLITTSKSWMLKVALVGLFALSIIKQTKRHAKRFLLLGLALGPGLQLFVVGVQELSTHSSIDFGEKYMANLKEKVDKVKEEKSALMAEHTKNLTQTNNGHKGLAPLRKLKDDVSYDFKRLGNGIDGDYKEIRLLISSAGNEMTTKIFGFCSMVLFCLLLLPSGYSLIIYILFNSMFKNDKLSAVLNKIAGGAASEASHLEGKKGDQNGLFSWFRKKTKAVADEVESKEKEIETAVDEEIDDHEHKITDTIAILHSDVLKHIKQDEDRFSQLFEKVKGKLKGDASHESAETHHLKTKLQERVEGLENKFKNSMAQVHSEITKHIDEDKVKLAQAVSSGKHELSEHLSKLSPDIDHIKEQIQSHTDDIKNEFSNMVASAHTDIKDHIQQEKTKLSDSLHDVRQKLVDDTTHITSTVDQLKTTIEDHTQGIKTEFVNVVKDAHTDVLNHVQQVKQDLETDTSRVKSDVNQLKANIQNQTQAVKTELTNAVDNAHTDVMNHVQNEKAKLSHSIQQVKQSVEADTSHITNEVSQLKTNIQNQTQTVKTELTQAVQRAHTEVVDHVQQEKAKIQSQTEAVKKDISQAMDGTHRGASDQSESQKTAPSNPAQDNQQASDSDNDTDNEDDERPSLTM